MKVVRPLAIALLAVALIAGSVRPPGGTRYFAQAVPPNPELIRLAGRSHLSLVADLFWIRTIATSINLKVPADGLVLIAWAQLVTDLDPQFPWPYLLGGLLGPMSFGDRNYNVAEANALLEKGMAAMPNEFRFPMYLSYNQLHLQGDVAGAAQTLRRGARAPGAPPFMAQLATRLLAQTNAFDAARSFAHELEDSSPDPEVREFFRKRKLEIERDETITRLQAAVDAFHERNGRWPTSLEQLVAEQALMAVPPEPLGGVYYLDAEGRVQSTSGKRLEANIQRGVP